MFNKKFVILNGAGRAVVQFTAVASGGRLIPDWKLVCGPRLTAALGWHRATNARVPNSCIAGIVRPIGDVLYGADWVKSAMRRAFIPYFKDDKYFGEDRFEPGTAPLVSPFIGGINPDLPIDSERQQYLWSCDPNKKASDYMFYPDEYKSLAKVYEEFVVSSARQFVVMTTICCVSDIESLRVSVFHPQCHTFTDASATQQFIRSPPFLCVIGQQHLVPWEHLKPGTTEMVSTRAAPETAAPASASESG